MADALRQLMDDTWLVGKEEVLSELFDCDDFTLLSPYSCHSRVLWQDLHSLASRFEIGQA